MGSDMAKHGGHYILGAVILEYANMFALDASSHRCVLYVFSTVLRLFLILPLAYLANVQQKYTKDWNGVKHVIRESEIKEQTFKYYWMLVNSRCYYWDFAQSRKRKRGEEKIVSVDECMALCPFADYFNHGSSGCTFNSTKAGCVITTHRAYEPEEEITLPYGTHNNDYLLVEYGFLLDENKHDCIQLDNLILPKLSTKMKTLLETLNYLG
jgi:hypothetical protein